MSRRFSKKQKIVHVLAYLKRNRLMSLATASRNKPWSATVFFAYDKNLNLIFFSREDTRHCKDIHENPYVSVAMNQDQQGHGIEGAQITGRASKVSSREHKKFYALYKSRFKWADEFASDHALYLIKPSEVWYINEKLFGHFNRVRIL